MAGVVAPAKAPLLNRDPIADSSFPKLHQPYVDAYTRAVEQYKREKAEWDAQQA